MGKKFSQDEFRALYNAIVDDLNLEQCESIGHEFRPIDSTEQLECIFCSRSNVVG